MKNYRVSFLDLAKINHSYISELRAGSASVISSGQYILGSEGARFEEEFANFVGTKYAIGCGNGLDALTIILRAYISTGRLQRGDAVLVPSNTFIATILSVIESGLQPILVDPDPATYNISISGCERAVRKYRQVRAIIGVHLYGRVFDHCGLRALCDSQNLLLIEDAAQAHGARSPIGTVGSLGDAAAFSFYPGKNLGALGDAGAITTSDHEIAEAARAVGNYGSKIKYHCEFSGVNSRLDELQGCFLRIKLKRYQEVVSRRRALSQIYSEGLDPEYYSLPYRSTESIETVAHVWHLYVVQCEHRDRFMKYMSSEGIETLVHYPICPADQKAFKGSLRGESVIARAQSQRLVSLPLNEALTNDDVKLVIDKANQFADIIRKS